MHNTHTTNTKNKNEKYSLVNMIISYSYFIFHNVHQWQVHRVWRKLVLSSFTFLSRNLGSVPYQDFRVPRDAFIELGSIQEV